MSISLSQALAL